MGCSGYIVFPGHKRLVGVIEGAGLPGYDTQPVRSRLCNEACDVGLTGNFSIRQLGHVAGLHRLWIIRMVRTTPILLNYTKPYQRRHSLIAEIETTINKGQCHPLSIQKSPNKSVKRSG